MHLISVFVANPVKVTVGVLLLVMFGIIALTRMPMQLSPDVQRPAITITTRWPGASPKEVEKQIVKEQEEQLKSVQGVTKMSSESQDSQGSVVLEFRVGTDMQEALLKVNTQLQQVRSYPDNSDEPVLRTSNSGDNAIAWFIVSALPVDDATIMQFRDEHPDLKDELDRVLRSHSEGLKVLRLRNLAKKYPVAESLLPPDLDVPKYRKFVEDNIEAQFERVPGVADSNVFGGQDPEMQVIVDPKELAARGLTIETLRRVLTEDNQDTSGGDFWESKRRIVVRTLGEYRSVEQIGEQIVDNSGVSPVHVKDVAEVKLGYKKPTGFVRRFGVSNIAVNCQRETGANVIEVMKGLRKTNQRLNNGILKREGLTLTQVYDETNYINSAVGLVNQNIVLGSALTIIVLMLFLHMSSRTLLFVPLLAISAIAAITISPWIFLLTLLLICIAGVWFARGALVVALAIPTSIIGTFLILNLMDRSLNVISLAGLAFAVGMLVDNAVVVLENIYRYYQNGHKPFDAAKEGAQEVWGAVLASTLTTLAVFLPVIFLEGEAGQLFLDIALAISAAVGLSLLVSVIVIPTAAARVLSETATNEATVDSDDNGRVRRFFSFSGNAVTEFVVGVNRWIQKGLGRRIAVVGILFLTAIVASYAMWPKVDYLPTGNRNLVICLILPPPGYNVEKLSSIGSAVEEVLKPYWDFDEQAVDQTPLEYPPIGDFFYVARGRSVFLGLRAQDSLKAAKLIDLLQAKLNGRFPGAFVVSFQSSLFGRGLEANRTVDLEITGPKLEQLVGFGGQIMGQVRQHLPTAQARPMPSLDLSTPEQHVIKRPQQATDLGMSSTELGYAVDALIDGAYVTDYYVDGEKIDLVIMGSKEYTANSQDLEAQYIATSKMPEPVRLGAIAQVLPNSGPEQINHRERQRAITIQVTPPENISLDETVSILTNNIIAPLEESGRLGGEYQIALSGTADKLKETWQALRWNILLAMLITYLLMAALFESWIYPFVIILSVPMGAVGGIIGLKLLGVYLYLQDVAPQSLDVLTMLGFVILIGTVVNNAILIVHQSLNLMRKDEMPVDEAILSSVRTRIRPIFMTTLTTLFGLSPLVFFPGAGSELYRGIGAVVLGGLLVSTIFTLVLVPTLFSLMLEARTALGRVLGLSNRDAHMETE